MSLPLEEGCIYLLADYNAIDLYKLGITGRDIQTRIAELNQSPGSAVKLLFLSPETAEYKKIEKKLHKLFAHKRTRTGENKKLREWFFLNTEDLKLLVGVLSYEFGEKPTKDLRAKIPRGDEK